LTYRFNKYRERHKIDKGVKFYSFKHTGLTDLINSKMVSLPQLQQHAGHDKITSTEKYIINHGGITNDVIKEKFSSPIAVINPN
jgi:integrase